MYDFQAIADCLATICDTGSKLDKVYLLKRYGHEVPGFKEVLKFIYNPYTITGLGKKKLDRVGINNLYASVDDIMNYLQFNYTGTDYDAEVANGFIYSSEDANWQWAATGLVTKDLQIGTSVTTLNSVYGKDFIPKIGIMRGMHCPKDAEGLYIETEKIDGNRRLLMNKETGVEVYTRSGHPDTGLIDIAKQVAKYLPKGYVYDTECIAIGNWNDNIECRQASASILNRRIGVKTGVCAMMFDMIPIAEYEMGKSAWAAVFRKYMIAYMFDDLNGMDLLESLMSPHQQTSIRHWCSANLPTGIKTCFIHGLPILGIAHTYDEAVEHAKPIWESGGEGLMLNEYRAPYEVNPNPRPTLLKIKATQEFVCKCIGVCEGDNKYAGMLGAIVVIYLRPDDPDGYQVKVGSGFADYLRVEYWKHPEHIIGKMVEIDSFGESKNANGTYSLNCPIFKRIRGEEE